MTAWLGRRSDPRVDYREPVRVIWPGEVSGVEGRAVNLSRTGILVDAPTPTPCEVGSELLCDVALPRHGSVLLRGRVAHRRLLSPAKVGMGIEFIDLSPGEAAELGVLVDAGDEKPQRVMVRFEGTDQTVRARAVATDAGFRLATALSFLKVGTALEVSIAAGGLPRATGQVSSVSLDVAQSDGVPRLLIDVRVDGATSLDEGDLTPVVETLVHSLREAVPEIVQDEAAQDQDQEEAGLGEEERTQIVERTQMVDVPPKLRPGWALSFGMLAGVAGLAAFGPLLLRHVKPAPVAVAPPAAAVESPAPVAPPVAPAAAAGAPEPAPPPVAEPAPPHFTIGLKGSLAGSRRYFLRAPDGVAFNLPHAEATIGHGTFEAALPGVRAVWVRPLAGGGTNVRVFFTAARPAPQVTLAPEGITVVAAKP